MAQKLVTVCLVAVSGVGCGADTGSPATGPEVLTQVLGDTTVVRTLWGSVWGAEATLVPETSIGELDGPEEYLFGSIYSITVDDDGRVFVLDGQARDIRVFDAEGTYVATVARRGEGPGELSNASSVAVLPDGRVIAHEAGDMLVKVVGPAPMDQEQWAYPPGALVLPVKPLRIDRLGRVLVPAAGTTPNGDFVQYLYAMGSDGEILDSLTPPASGFKPPSLEVRLRMQVAGRSTAQVAVPVTARHHWTTSPTGQFLSGISADYRIDVVRGDGVLRIERAYEPVPTSEAERDYHRERITQSLRRTQPDWSWNGPRFPTPSLPSGDSLPGGTGGSGCNSGPERTRWTMRTTTRRTRSRPR